MRRTTTFVVAQQAVPAEQPIKQGSREPFIPDPMNIFLKLKPSFLILTQNEIEAKILRIIEACLERAIAKQHGQPGDCLWVPISQHCFMHGLLGTVQSKTTLTDAIEHLKQKYFIFERPGQGHYKANEYLFNKPLIAFLSSLIPTNMDEIDMVAIMKRPRNARNKEGQKLPPTAVHPLVKKIQDTIFDPANRQFLTPPPTIIGTTTELTELRGGQFLTLKREYRKDTGKRKKEAATCAHFTETTTEEDAASSPVAPDILIIDCNHMTRDMLFDLQNCLNRLLALTQDEQANEQPLACSHAEENTDAFSDLQEQEHQNQEEDEQGQVLPTEGGVSAQPTHSAPAVVRLIEQLRGRAYTASERSRELKAAFTLLNLAEAPQLSLEEIHEAWEHGSDDWWRERYGDDVHVHDLIQKTAQGKRRVLAFLEHKRRSARFATASDRVEVPYVPVQDTLPPPPEMPETYNFLACEADAAAIAAQIEHDGQARGYDIVTHVVEDEYHSDVWFVQVEWRVDTNAVTTHRVSSWPAWERYFAQQHAIMQYNAVPA